MPRFAHTLAALLALALPASQVQAQADARPCIGEDEAAGLLLALAPDLIAAVGTTCAPVLPPSALLRQGNGAFAAKYRGAADAAWDKGRSALAKLAGPDAAAMLDSDYARPMLGALAVPLLTKQLKVQDCPAINRILTEVAPLPPRNTAQLVVTILQLTNADRARQGRKPDLPICPMTTATP